MEAIKKHGLDQLNREKDLLESGFQFLLILG